VKHAPAIAKAVLYATGLLSVTYGCWLIYRPLGYLAAGLLCVALSFVIDKETESK